MEKRLKKKNINKEPLKDNQYNVIKKLYNI